MVLTQFWNFVQLGCSVLLLPPRCVLLIGVFGGKRFGWFNYKQKPSPLVGASKGFCASVFRIYQIIELFNFGITFSLCLWVSSLDLNRLVFTALDMYIVGGSWFVLWKCIEQHSIFITICAFVNFNWGACVCLRLSRFLKDLDFVKAEFELSIWWCFK